MNTREKSNVEEVTWMLKLRTPMTVMGIPFASRTSTDEAFGLLSDFLRTEGIKPVIQLHEPVHNRYLTIISLSPTWGFALRNKLDNWDYMEEVERLKGIMVGNSTKE